MKPAAVSVLESAAQLYPDDVLINYSLAEALAGLPARREDAVRYYTAARAATGDGPQPGPLAR